MRRSDHSMVMLAEAELCRLRKEGAALARKQKAKTRKKQSKTKAKWHKGKSGAGKSGADGKSEHDERCVSEAGARSTVAN